MKRIISFVILLTMLLSFAGTEYVIAAGRTTHITPWCECAESGGEAQLTLSLSGNPGIAYLRMAVALPEGVKAVRAEGGEVFPDVEMGKTGSGINILCSADENTHKDGKLCDIVLAAENGLPIGDYPIGIRVMECYDEETGDAACETKNAILTVIDPDEEPIRLAGEKRTETAALIADGCFTQAENVVIASGQNYADALVGVPLAYALDAPILLVCGTLDSATAGEIEKLGAKHIYVLGGPAAVNEDVVEALRAKYSVERIAGDTRYETACMTAKKLEEVTGSSPAQAFIACAENYPDALAAGCIAARMGSPILYAAGNGGLKETANYLKVCGIKSAVILGGTSAVSNVAEEKLAECGVENVERVAGEDRYETCLMLNRKYAAMLEGWEVCVATGLNYPDALAGGVYAAVKRAPMLLVKNRLSLGQAAFIGERKPKRITVFGGVNAVSDLLLEELREASK